MFYRPRRDSAEARAAADRIIARRTDAHDPDLGLLGDDLLAVLTHVATRHRVPPRVQVVDTADAVIIHDHLGHLLDHLLLSVLRATGQGPTALAGTLGLTTRMHAAALVRRLTDAVEERPKDSAKARERRRKDTQARDRDAALARTRARELYAAAGDLLCRPLPDVDAGVDPADLRADLAAVPADAPLPEVLVAELRLLLRELAPLSLPADTRRSVETLSTLLAGNVPERDGVSDQSGTNGGLGRS